MEASSAYETGYAIGRYGAYALVGLLALGGGIFFIIALIKAITRKTRGWIIATVISGVLALFGVVGLIGVAANAITKLAKNASKSSGSKKTVDSTDGRFHVEVPTNWRAMPELHADAQIEAGNALAEQYVIVIENLKTDYVGTLADFDELVIGQMKGNLPGVEVSEPETRPVGSYPAIHRRLAATVDNIRVVYFIASIETETGFYQMLTWTMRSREAEAQPVLKAVVDSFTSQDGPPAPKPPPPGPDATIHERVVWIVTEQLGLAPEKVTPESRFIEDLGADSLDTVELVMATEEEFDVTIPDEVAEKLVTVGDLVSWLEKKPVE